MISNEGWSYLESTVPTVVDLDFLRKTVYSKSLKLVGGLHESFVFTVEKE